MGFVGGKKEIDWHMMPFIILFLIFPLVEIPLTVKNRYAGYYFSPMKEYQNDYYLVGKMVLLLVVSVWILIVLIDSYRKKINMKSMISEMLLFLLLMISSFCSIDKKLSFMGANELFEPFPVILAYIIIFFGAKLIIKNEKTKRDRFQNMIFFLAAGSILVTLVGILQYAEGTSVASTLYNPDYVGTYAAIILPLFIISIFGKYLEKNKGSALVNSAIIMTVIVLFLSRSLAGIAACSVGIITGISLIKFGNDTKKLFLIAAGIVIVFVLVLSFEWIRSYSPEKYHDFSFTTGGESAEFSYHEEKILIKMETGSSGKPLFVLSDAKGKAIGYEEDIENKTLVPILPESSVFYGFHFNPISLNNGKKGFVVFFGDRQWYLGMDSYGKCHSINAYGNFMDMDSAEKNGFFENRESFLHGRGYIWDRAAPLLKHYWLWGGGPDTFPLIFSQKDIDKVLVSGFAYEDIILKPHNLYLQICTQLGLPFLLVFINIIYSIIRNLIKRTRTEKDKKKRIVTAAIISSIMGFLVVSVVNDSSICVSPIMAAILGVGKGYASEGKERLTIKSQ